jgi:ATP-dependent protease ClpP protease subunit
MMYPDPLVDLDARVLSVSVNTPSQIVIDRLLRLQNGDDWREPITLYIAAAEDNRSVGVLDFLQIHAIIQTLRSPVRTVALGGMLRGYEVLLLADGERGHRHILEHSLLCLEPFRFQGLPFTDGPIGMEQVPGLSMREQAEQLLTAEMGVVLQRLRLEPTLFETARIIGAAEAISRGIADLVVPVAKPNPEPAHKRNHRRQEEINNPTNIQ